MRTVKTGSDGLPQVFNIAITGVAHATQGDGSEIVTFTCAIPHKLAVGDRVTITGILDNATSIAVNFLNNSGGAISDQSFKVGTVPTTTTFTVTYAAGPTYTFPGAYNLTNAIARKRLSSDQYDPFATVYANRLQIVDWIPDSSLYIHDTAVHNGTWVELLALTACVVNTLTSSTISGFATGLAIPAGTRIRGNFTSISLTSGTLLASA